MDEHAIYGLGQAQLARILRSACGVEDVETEDAASDSTLTQDDARRARREDFGAPGEKAAMGLPVPEKPWGDYLILECLDCGGQATVFRACLRQDPDRQFALKVPAAWTPAAPPAAWPDAEVETLRELDHPNILKIDRAGVVGGVPYLAAELVKGLPLGDHVSASPPSLQQILSWMIRLTEAVGHAHTRGVTHRDLKPRNIMITRQGEPKIIDFGISSLVSPYGGERREGRAGTLSFMAPEVARNDCRDYNRVDVFGLGTVLKYLLDGVGPYGRREDCLQAAMAGEVQSVDGLRGPPLRRALARIAGRALQANPELRYANVAEMNRDLCRLRDRPRLIRRLVLAVATGALLAVGTLVIALALRGSAGTVDATLEIHVQRADQKGAYQLLTPDLLPLRTGDKIQIHATLSRPLVAYLVALGPRGEVTVLCPDVEGHAARTRTIAVPSGRDQWLPLRPPGGTETILLLARQEPVGSLAALKERLASLGRPPSVQDAAMMVVGLQGVVLMRYDGALHRNIDTQVVEENKGMLASLLETVPREWVLVRAVCFPHVPAGKSATENISHE